MTKVRAFKFAGTTLVALIALAGCGGGDAPPPAEEMPADDGMGEMEMPAEAGRIEVEMTTREGFSADGALLLTRSGTDLRAEIRAESRIGPGDYPLVIHRGSCAAEGPAVVSLTSMEGQEGGEGTSLTIFPASQLPLDGTYYLMMHRSDGTPIACGDFPSLADF